jgi:GGDEF domain-containing protein
MSPTRPEREHDGAQASPVPSRSATTRVTSVTGPAEVEAHVDLQLSQCRRRGGILALLSISVDAVGQADGPADVTLERRVRQEVSNRIGNAVRGSDAILRESERDTVVVLPGADEAVADRVRQRLERLLGGAYCVEGQLLQASVRIGAAAHPAHGARAPELLRRAAGPD